MHGKYLLLENSSHRRGKKIVAALKFIFLCYDYTSNRITSSITSRIISIIARTGVFNLYSV